MNDETFRGVMLTSGPVTAFLAEDGLTVTQFYRDDAEPEDVEEAWHGLLPELYRCGLPHDGYLAEGGGGYDPDGWEWDTFTWVQA